ncbi:MAG: PSD1 and planctomycete cytochrome C domain-containing protein [Verrucomicrobiota bacterium]
MMSRPTQILLLLLVAPVLAEADFSDEQIAFFESKIRPVLVKECFGCHSDRSGKMRGGLRLDTRQLMLMGGETGPAIVPGKPEESLLFTSMLHENGLAMPPKRTISNRVIEDFRQRIEMGAPDPRKSAAAVVQSTVTEEDVLRARQSFWAYRPVEDVQPPEVEQTDWPKTEIDRFVLEKLEQAELKPAADDQPHRVLRRLSFDLLGLPPTLEQIAYFRKEWAKDPDAAIAMVVDIYLKRPQFGERWGRHWLDVARYAESTGGGVNITFPHAWRFRDYVIDSFNDDKPFDQFVKEQIAGDLLPAKDEETWAEQLAATTFLAIGPKNINEMNSAQFQADLIDEQVDATSRVFLGMSLACARCHDHKFDAIPQADYYAMAGFFSSSKTYFGNPVRQTNPMVQQDSGILEYPIDKPGPQKIYTTAEHQELKDKLATLREGLGAGPSFQSIQNRIYIGQLENELASLDEQGRPLSYCMGVQCKTSPSDATLLKHGEVDQPGYVIPRGFPSVLSNSPAEIKSETSGRRELAEWIAHDRNPLTARVMVNRVWHHLLGQGIVTSTNDFGATGQPPTHPELLDYLTTNFIESGWSVKTLVRDITTSRVYRMSSAMDPEAFAFDSTNSLLWRAHPRRLDAESIRDNMLAVSGQLDLQRPHGSEVSEAGFVRVRNGVLEDLSMGIGGMVTMGMKGGMKGKGGKGPKGRMQSPAAAEPSSSKSPFNRLDMMDATFRSVYLPHVRNETPRSLDVFDPADSNAIVGDRATSDTADQALYLLNNPFVLAQSRAFAKRLESEASNPVEQIRLAFLLAYGRPPTPSESQGASGFLRDMRDAEDPLALLCQSLFASAEFRYIY